MVPEPQLTRPGPPHSGTAAPAPTAARPHPPADRDPGSRPHGAPHPYRDDHGTQDEGTPAPSARPTTARSAPAVESSFAAGVGRSLLDEGVVVDWNTLKITDKCRRRSVTGIIEATTGFQHGRCLICTDILTPSHATAVDHVFPFALMHRFAGVGAWRGPDLDALWNLAPHTPPATEPRATGAHADGTCPPGRPERGHHELAPPTAPHPATQPEECPALPGRGIVGAAPAGSAGGGLTRVIARTRDVPVPCPCAGS